MSNLAYLGLAVVLSTIGALVIWLRNRRPTSLMSGIEQFQRERDALARERLRTREDGRAG